MEDLSYAQKRKIILEEALKATQIMRITYQREEKKKKEELSFPDDVLKGIKMIIAISSTEEIAKALLNIMYRLDILEKAVSHNQSLSLAKASLGYTFEDIEKYIIKQKKAEATKRVVEVVFEKFCVLVPTGNSNSHNYTIGEPTICIGTPCSDYFLKVSSHGNHMTRNIKDIRICSDDEVRDFIRGLTQNQVSYIFDQIKN